jgi:hypothetical protein
VQGVCGGSVRSSAARGFDGRDVDLAHRHHGLERAASSASPLNHRQIEFGAMRVMGSSSAGG